jgi:hypothetical protein
MLISKCCKKFVHWLVDYTICGLCHRACETKLDPDAPHDEINQDLNRRAISEHLWDDIC